MVGAQPSRGGRAGRVATRGFHIGLAQPARVGLDLHGDAGGGDQLVQDPTRPGCPPARLMAVPGAISWPRAMAAA